MRRLFLGRSLLLLWALLANYGSAATPECKPDPNTPQRAFPSIEAGCKLQVHYVGSYEADAKYRASSRLQDTPHPASMESRGLRPAEVPARWSLHPREQTIHNFLPSVHAKARVHNHSLLARWRDDLLTFAYGHERAFLQPRYVTTDARGRVLVGDPAASAVHVLDGDQSFRISASSQDRLRSIAGVAADREGNIYVGDPEAGVIVVFDSLGRWLREMGRFSENEGLFNQIAGVAIDRDRERLYVADPSRNAVLILDLQGKVLARVGGRRHELGLTFEHPTAITAKYGVVLVADMDGTRIQVLDADGRLLRTFYTYLPRARGREVSLDIDKQQNTYVTDLNENCVHIFSADGILFASMGSPGTARGAFAAPSAVWIDENNQLYICDSENRRVQVFELQFEEPALQDSVSAQASR
jgi:DNA-binding beta-propeller fold protein YncE